MIRLATAASNQVIAVCADGALSLIAAWAADDAVSTLPGIAGDDRIHIVQMAPDVDTSTLARGAVITDGAVDEAQRARDVNPASDRVGSVATDGAIGEHCRAIGVDKNTSAGTKIEVRNGILRFVTADGAVDEHQCTSRALDTTTVASLVAGGCDSIGGVVVDGAVDQRQRTSVADTGSRVRSIITDDAVLECQRAIVHYATAALFLSTWPAVSNRHFLKDCGSPLLNEDDALRGLFRCLVGLYDDAVGSQSPDSDVLVHDNARLGVDRVGDLNDCPGLCTGIVYGGLDGGKIATGGTHGVGGW